MKPGYLTTEFWLTVVVSAWSALSPTLPTPYNVAIPVVAVGLYSIARGLSKVGVIGGSVGGYLKTAPDISK